MGKSRRLITLMLATSVGIGITAGLSGCSKSEEEMKAEDQIRQLLEYDANINIEKDYVDQWGFEIITEIKNQEYLITFKTKQYISRVFMESDTITYSVDKDTYYDFRNNYKVVETSDEVNMVYELTLSYDPVVVISKNEEVKNDL